MRRGFSLLEVIVALAIMALSLMAIFDMNAGAVRKHVYTKKLTVATLLARSKMIDLEQELHDKGLSNDDDEESGDFSEEGWKNFKWRAKILAPRTQGLSPDKLMAALFNLPMGDASQGNAGSGLSALFGGGASAGGSMGANQGGVLSALGPMSGMIQGQFTQMIDVITKSVREVHLTVSWKEGNQVESLDLVTHVVSLGPGSDRNLWSAGAVAAAGVPAGGAWVRADGRPVANAVMGPNGSMVDPSDNSPVFPAAQWAGPQGASGGNPLPTNPFQAAPGNSLNPFGVGKVPLPLGGGLR